jgi:hypothetical protein
VLHTWEDLLHAANVYGYPNGPGFFCLLDEIHLWWESNEKKVPEDLAQMMSQLRKLKITLFITAQDWSFVPTRLRRLCFGVWVGKRWGGNRHQYDLYDTPRSSTIPQAAKRIGRIRLRRKKHVMEAYDTKEFVTGAYFGSKADRITEAPQRTAVGRAAERSPTVERSGPSVVPELPVKGVATVDEWLAGFGETVTVT